MCNRAQFLHYHHAVENPQAEFFAQATPALFKESVFVKNGESSQKTRKGLHNSSATSQISKMHVPAGVHLLISETTTVHGLTDGFQICQGCSSQRVRDLLDGLLETSDSSEVFSFDANIIHSSDGTHFVLVGPMEPSKERETVRAVKSVADDNGFFSRIYGKASSSESQRLSGTPGLQNVQHCVHNLF